MADKLLKYDVAMKSTKTVWQMETPRCYTGDENTVTFDFNITDLEAADLVGVIPNVYLYMRDGSFFQNGPADGVEITGTIVNYTMKGNEGKHSGIARAQLVLVWDDEINPPEKLTSQLYDFEVVSGLENKVAVEVMIQDWTTLTREARTFIDTSSDEVDALKGELQTAINTANASLGEFDVALETGIVAANLAEKLEDFEEINNSRLLSTERQLADTLNKSAITLTHMFADNAERDVYFVTHPTELIELQFVKVGTAYQQYIEGVWTGSVPIVSEQLSATNQPIVDTGEYFVAENTNEVLQELGAHKASTANPHGVTKAQVGLGNVDNTSDANKPVSTAMQTALNLKANKVQEAWITPTLLNGWVNNATYGGLKYYKDEFGIVTIKGTITNSATPNGGLICMMPVGYRPEKYIIFNTAQTTGSTLAVSCFVDQWGNFQYYGTPSNMSINLQYKAEA